MTPLDFLNLLWRDKPPGLFVLIWSLLGKESHWFQDIGAAAEFVQRAYGRNIYIGVGLSDQDRGLHHRCVSAEIGGIAGFAVDLDLKSEAHNKKPLPATIEDALTLIPPDLPPTIIIATGNGLQAWWFLEEPWIFGNGDERKEAAALSLRLQTLFRYNSSGRGWSFERLADLARVLRMPGTINAKDPANPKAVEVYSVEGRRYNPFDFRKYLDGLAIPDLETEECVAKEMEEQFTGKPLVINFDAAIPDDRLARWMEKNLRFRNTWTRQRHDMNDQSGSGYDIALAHFGLDTGLNDQEIVDLIVHHRRIHGEKRRKDLDYYQRTISKAARTTGRPTPHVPGTSPAPEGAAAPQNAPDDSAAAENAHSPEDDDPNRKAKLCEQLSHVLGVRILRLVKVTGKEPVYLMELEDGRVEFDVAKLISQKSVGLALAGKVGKIIPTFKSQMWRGVAQMFLDACTVMEGTDDLELEGAARIQIEKYLSENPLIASLEGASAHDRYKPVVDKGRIAVSASDIQNYISRTSAQNISVKSVAAMLAALGAQPVRVRHRGVKEQGRWALPLNEFDLKDFPLPNLEDDGNAE